MKYYQLTYSNIRKEVGKNPQSEDCNIGDIQQDFIPWYGNIDFDFRLPEPILVKSAKPTSYLHVIPINKRFLVIEDDLLALFKTYKIGRQQDWKIKVWHKEKLLEQYNLFFLNDIQNAKYIDFKKSEFLIGKLGDWKDPSIRKPISIENYSEYETIKNTLRANNEGGRIRSKKVSFNLSNAQEDMFRFFNIPYAAHYYVSERLKDAVLEKGFTGMAFKEISELDRVEVVY